MPPGTLDDRYLEWLYSQVAVVKHRRSAKTHWGLLKQLYSIEFTWSIVNDEDRAADGINLRLRWAADSNERPIPYDANWFELPCSFLEMLIALADRAAFQSSMPLQHWFWEFMKNLGFDGFTDTVGSPSTYQTVQDVTFMVITRTYDEFNSGGLFPLHRTKQDQRKVDLWYQLCTYLLQD